MHLGKFQHLILNWLHFSLFNCFIAVTTMPTFYRVSATKMSFAWFWLHRAFFWVLKKYLKITWKLRTAMAINDNTVPHTHVQTRPAHPFAPFNTHSTLGAEFHIFGGFCSSVCGSLCVCGVYFVFFSFFHHLVQHLQTIFKQFLGARSACPPACHAQPTWRPRLAKREMALIRVL